MKKSKLKNTVELRTSSFWEVGWKYNKMRIEIHCEKNDTLIISKNNILKILHEAFVLQNVLKVYNLWTVNVL